MKNDEALLGEGRFVKLVRAADGWEYAERVGTTGASVIAGFTADKKIVLVEQFRTPLDSNVIELPAGLAGDNERYGADFTLSVKRERVLLGKEFSHLLFHLLWIFS